MRDDPKDVNNFEVNKVIICLDYFLSSHSNLSALFSEKGYKRSDVSVFYMTNIDSILSLLIDIFENWFPANLLNSELITRSMASKCARWIRSHYNDGNSSLIFHTLHKKMIKAALVRLLANEDLTIGDFSSIDEESNNENKNYWYRGQSDYDWFLTPSLLRNLNNVFSKETHIDSNVIYDLYSKGGMMGRWNSVFNSNTINYDFLSYMQHAISYSPLLDFTSDCRVALSFSLGNKASINDFGYKDSAIYKLEVQDDKKKRSNLNSSQFLSNFSIDYLPHPYTIGSPINGKQMNTLQDIRDELTPDYVMLDSVCNDRMRYQNGRFVLFYNYFSIQGKVCTWLNKNLRLSKLRVKVSDKPKHCKDLAAKCPHLLMKKMMDPYCFFSDQ